MQTAIELASKIEGYGYSVSLPVEGDTDGTVVIEGQGEFHDYIVGSKEEATLFLSVSLEYLESGKALRETYKDARLWVQD